MSELLLLALLVAASPSDAACRDPKVKHQFDVEHGYPHGRKGYVVDHICALAQGGLDSTINMQYQTIEDGHKKDRVENTPEGKALYCNKWNSTSQRMVFNCR